MADPKFMKSLGSSQTSNFFTTKDKDQVPIEEYETRNAFSVADLQNNSNLDSFNRFREKLHARTEKWFESKLTNVDGHGNDSSTKVSHTPSFLSIFTLIT